VNVLSLKSGGPYKKGKDNPRGGGIKRGKEGGECD